MFIITMYSFPLQVLLCTRHPKQGWWSETRISVCSSTKEYCGNWLHWNELTKDFIQKLKLYLLVKSVPYLGSDVIVWVQLWTREAASCQVTFSMWWTRLYVWKRWLKTEFECGNRLQNGLCKLLDDFFLKSKLEYGGFKMCGNVQTRRFLMDVRNLGEEKSRSCLMLFSRWQLLVAQHCHLKALM
jgi:hypothetical protein